ncbi:MAG TPA: hypothetical protein VFT65_10840 [Candidatus Angelobacter sp.]|nr:hypothetical protein [Candidatus Angelobacter sp.]
MSRQASASLLLSLIVRTAVVDRKKPILLDVCAWLAIRISLQISLQ